MKKNMTKRIFSLMPAFVMVLSILLAAPVTANAAKPADGTASVPFPTGIMGSGHYRIPALITTNDGTLVAAADARWHTWDTTDDNGDIDTIVSYSTDNGSSWKYSFANYIDNGNTTNYNAATFIDPALAYDGETIYMIVDLYPGQSGQTNCTASSKAGTGYDSQGRLLLSKYATASFSTSYFSYYLDGGKIYSSSGADQGYTVDAWFNVTKTSTGVSCGNLFDYNNTCGFHPLMTSHLYMTKSTDNGKTWSAPQMLNHQVKGNSNAYYLVSPGRGFYDANTGAIVFGAYDNNAQASMIFSLDGGNTWKRTANVSGTSSENEIVQLEDGTLRMFLRHYDSDYTIKYVDATWNGSTYTWGSIQNTYVAAHNNTNVSAISYSKYSDGKQVILVSCPGATSGAWSRTNGKIFTFLVDPETNTMTKAKEYVVTSGDFSYSCMTELEDGTIGMLYEKGDSGNITYAEFSAETITGLTFDADDSSDTEDISITDAATGITVTAPGLTGLTVSQMTAPSVEDAVDGHVKAWSITASTDEGLYTGSAEVSVPVPAGWTHVEVLGMEGTVKNGYLTLNVPSLGSVVIYDRDTSVLVELERGESLTMMDTTGDYASSYTGADLDKTIAQVTIKGVPGVSETTVDSVKATTLENGATYIIRAYNTSYALSSNAGRGDWGTTTRAYEYNALTANTAHMWTLEASGNGYKLKNDAGYLNLGTGNNSAYLNSTGEVFNITYTSTGWTIGNGSVYVNALGGLTWYYSAGGWISDNTRFDFYKVTEKTDATTEITFTGISTGTTYTTVGNTTYKIVVEGGACVHNYAADTQAPTCETAGLTTYTCTLCGEGYTEEIPALGHDYKTVTVEATCESAGSVTTTCATCGDKTVETIPALGHDYKTVTVEATCESAGSVTTTCATCSDKTVETIPALGHNYKTTTVAATCTTGGYTSHTCATCGKTYTSDETAALGHTYTSKTVEATCETAGGTVYTCTTCGYSYTGNQVAALGHTYKTTTVAATCTTAGSATKTCATCGDKTVETIPALGHTYKTTTVAATCESAGSATKTCATCGDSSVETIPALGHNYKTTTVAATCESAGSVTTACANCGDKTVETIPALGHSYTSTTVAPTCTAGGYTSHKCSTCGNTYTSNQTAALGHSYTSQQVGNDMVYTCTNCGHSYSETLVKNYTYDKVTAFTSGESYVITLYSNRKYYAVTHTNNTIGVKQVTVSGSKITTEITDDMLWDYSSSKLSYESNGKTYYLYAQTSSSWWNSSTTLTLSTTSSSTVSFSGSKLKVGSSNYLRYSGNKVSLNRSATTSYLFKQNEQ